MIREWDMLRSAWDFGEWPRAKPLALPVVSTSGGAIFEEDLFFLSNRSARWAHESMSARNEARVRVREGDVGTVGLFGGSLRISQALLR